MATTKMGGDVQDSVPAIDSRSTQAGRTQNERGDPMPTSRRDHLPGIHDRAEFEEQLRRAVRECHDARSPLSLLLFRVDKLGIWIDDVGYRPDELLNEVLPTVQRALRAEDVLGHCGDSRFGAIVRGLTRRGTEELAERVRAAVEAQETRCPSAGITATVSIGATYTSPSLLNPDGLVAYEAGLMLKLARQALVDAEAKRGNRVVMIARG